MTDLLTRLGSGSGSDRLLDVAILYELDREQWERFQAIYVAKMTEAAKNGLTNRDDACWRFGFGDCPLFTSSLDAALSLVERLLPGKEVEIVITPTGTKCTIFVEVAPGAWDGHKGRNKTPARAACAALLRALDQEPQT